MNERITWIDAAKGITILMVVLYPSTLFMQAIHLDGPWMTLMIALSTFRMPLFFFAAGIFAAQWRDKPFMELALKRLLPFLYLYIVWSILRFAVFVIVPWILSTGDAGSLEALLAIFTNPRGTLWFIYGLALLFLTLRVTRRVPLWALVAISGSTSAVIGAGLLPYIDEGWEKILLHGVYFFAAAYWSTSIRTMARQAQWKHVITSGITYVTLTATAAVTPLFEIPGGRLFVSIVAIAFGVSFTVKLQNTVIGRSMAWLGSRTMPIYLIHYFPAAIIAAALQDLQLDPSLGLVAPIIVAAVCTYISIIAAKPLGAIPGVLGLPLWPHKAPVISKPL